MSSLSEPTKTIREEARGRQAAYALFGRLFERELEREDLASLASGPGAVVLRAFVEAGLPASEAERIIDVAGRADESTVETLNVEYTSLFEAHNRIYPHASCWGATKPMLMGAAWHKVLDFYREAGLAPEDDKAWLADHVGTELYFASVLAARAADAQSSKRVKEAHETFVAFLGGHVLPWVPRFLESVEADPRADFYADVARIALAFIELDVAMLEPGLISTVPESSI